MSGLLLSVDFNPVREFIVHPYLDLPFGLGISKAVIYLWMSAAVATLLPILVIRRGLGVKPDGEQTALEYVYEVCEEQIAKQGLPDEGMRIWFPYVATLFFFIWAMNLIGFIPLPFGTEERFHIFGVGIPQFQIYAATANLSVTLTLTLVTVIASHVEGVRYNGPIKYLRSWLPSGIPSFAKPALFVIEALSQAVRIVSLSFRLFFNMLAGHLVIAVFLAIGALIGPVVGYFLFAVTIPMGIAIYTLEATLIAALQAFIFAALSAIYIGGAIHPDH